MKKKLLLSLLLPLCVCACNKNGPAPKDLLSRDEIEAIFVDIEQYWEDNLDRISIPRQFQIDMVADVYGIATAASESAELGLLRGSEHDSYDLDKHTLMCEGDVELLGIIGNEGTKYTFDDGEYAYYAEDMHEWNYAKEQHVEEDRKEYTKTAFESEEAKKTYYEQFEKEAIQKYLNLNYNPQAIEEMRQMLDGDFNYLYGLGGDLGIAPKLVECTSTGKGCIKFVASGFAREVVFAEDSNKPVISYDDARFVIEIKDYQIITQTQRSVYMTTDAEIIVDETSEFVYFEVFTVIDYYMGEYKEFKKPDLSKFTQVERL